MAMGKPIITTNAAGCKETVEDGVNGYLVPPKDNIALAEAMTKMYHASPGDLEKMGKKSRIFALDKFDDKIIASKYLHLLDKLLLNKPDEQPARSSESVF